MCPPKFQGNYAWFYNTCSVEDIHLEVFSWTWQYDCTSIDLSHVQQNRYKMLPVYCSSSACSTWLYTQGQGPGLSKTTFSTCVIFYCSQACHSCLAAQVRHRADLLPAGEVRDGHQQLQARTEYQPSVLGAHVLPWHGLSQAEPQRGSPESSC